ncbi:MAG: M20 family metallo-hydrolase [Muribaculaceae bacterium]|nr:M20 family metallo-hydrolase [Muribaculaceae bacterium]
MSKRAISLLDSLIATPSISRDEAATADIIETFLKEAGVSPLRLKNNVWAIADGYNPSLPTLLLNSHHDTVRPAATYTIDPFTPLHRDGKIYGLGSNDAGGSVVSLSETFLSLNGRTPRVNLILAITAEEEVSGHDGIELLLNDFRQRGLKIDMAIVGEPTGLNAAVAERGLMVLDCTAKGVSGHAARNEGVNAIYRAIEDIGLLRDFRFEKVSPVLGDIKISVTQISAGTQHNVVPDRCTFVADVRTTDAYTNEEVAAIIASRLSSVVVPRSTRLSASVIAENHPLVRAAVALGAEKFISPTMSDRALLNGIPALKIGPGDSARSHTADEYIFEDEIVRAIDFYQQLILSL